jgi:hypothetical protein
MLMFAIVLAAGVQVAAQTPATAGSLVGCMSDTMTHRVPGATIVAKSGGVQRTTVADAAGCYELKDLPPASYRVTARLTGFDNVTRDRVVLAAATVTHLDFTMRVSALCECVRIGGSLADHRDHADAVLHVRLADSEAAQSTPQGYYRHIATVVTAVKQPTGSRPAAIFLLQNQQSGTPDPYDVGQELVAFVESSGSDAFRITNDEVSSMVFLVQDGRIQRAPSEFSRYVGMPIDSFLGELRTLSRRK